ncbi:CRISPR-associated protein, GSU0053 family [Thioflavicoccus mobilis 8321]|uniref:CRISPR-associated protein, GSU0053 family n=1 Tax=Thioflavicoccus mobilis 8321 TaxID=765912 RepID=L0GW72_9GAMM|nr:type I-U CRISPR-associated RAMP protein Csb1/Cas7u [Thioflavicoccus mobilis]AGA90077.1 CRISPR-associated protein, GSU0053 family [Thioflavicoccus mobilis 8321]
MSLELETLKAAVAGNAAAFRCVTEYQPMGGPGDKVFPPTYEGGRYATEARVDPATDERVDCVLLDSVQSQANRMEQALLDAVEERGSLTLPLIRVAFTDVPKPIRVTSLDAPHRAADAIFRDSRIEEDGEWRAFRESSKGRILDHADLRNATGLFGLCPTALVFGLWDSTGPRGGLGAKFQRALVSEIVGYGAVEGKKTASRIDPLQIMLGAGPVYTAEDGGWTLSEAAAKKVKGKPVKIGKDGKPSEINHGNVTPSIADGGFTLTRAVQTTVLSLPTLRRLRFPLPDGAGAGQLAANQAARTALAALGLAAATLAREEGTDLRSRCQLFPTDPFVWALLDRPGETPTSFTLTGAEAVDLLNRALDEARQSGLPWEGIIDLTPSPDLVELVRRSQHLAAQADGED